MYRFLGLIPALSSLPAARGTVLYTNSTESGGVLQWNDAAEISAASQSGSYLF